MKKYLKNILAATMVLSMATALAACGSAPADNKEDANADGAENSGKQTLTLATSADFPPYEFYEGGEIVGIDAEVAKAIADKLGYEFKIEDMIFDAVIPAIVSGKADIGMAGLTITEERQQSVDFTDSYATGVQSVIVKEDSDIKSVDDLLAEGANHKVGVQTTTTGDFFTTDDIEKAGKGTVERYNKGADAIEALKVGKVDCVVIDNEPAKAFVAANEGLKILDTQYASEDYAIALGKNSELTAEINQALKELKEDGTIKGIVDKYIKAE